MCVCLSVRASVPECIVCACKHASVRVCACARAWGRMCESIRPSVCLSACMFVRPNVWSYMYAFINVCVHVFACTRAWGRMFGSVVHPSVCLSACMFVRPNVCSHMRKRIEKMIVLKRLYKSQKQVKSWSFMNSFDVKFIFVNIYGLCRNWVMNKLYTIRTLVSNMGICKTLNFTKSSRVFYIIIANYCMKSCRRPKEFWHDY